MRPTSPSTTYGRVTLNVHSSGFPMHIERTSRATLAQTTCLHRPPLSHNLESYTTSPENPIHGWEYERGRRRGDRATRGSHVKGGRWSRPTRSGKAREASTATDRREVRSAASWRRPSNARESPDVRTATGGSREHRTDPSGGLSGVVSPKHANQRGRGLSGVVSFLRSQKELSGLTRMAFAVEPKT